MPRLLSYAADEEESSLRHKYIKNGEMRLKKNKSAAGVGENLSHQSNFLKQNFS